MFSGIESIQEEMTTPASSGATASTVSATATTSSSVGTVLSHFANILPPNPLDILACQSNAENWHLWKQQWTNYAIVTGLGTRDLFFQRAIFQSAIGPDALQVFNTMVFPDDQYTVQNILDKFEVMMTGELNETYERYVFTLGISVMVSLLILKSLNCII